MKTPLLSLSLAALMAAGSLSACTTLPQSAPFASEPSAAKKVNPIDAIAEQSWWQGFGDPQLNSLMSQAFNSAPSLAMAEARLNQAEAITAQYHAAGSPTLGLAGNATETKQSYNYLFPRSALPDGYTDYGQVTLNFNWELDFWGKNRAAIAAATSQASAAAADAAQARLVLSAAVAGAYIDLDHLYQSRDLALSALRIRQDSAHLVQQKFSNGVSNASENELAKAGVFAAEADVAAIDEQIELTRHQISALIGAAPDATTNLQRPALSANAKAGAAPSQISADLIGRRPDIIAARWRAEAASAQIKEAHAAFYPNINLAGYAGFQSLNIDKLLKSGSDIGQIGPAISLPLFDGGALKANLKTAESEHALAIASYNQTVLTAMQQVADTVSSQKALKSRLDSSQAALTAYEEAYRLTKLRYDGGLSNYTALLLAEQSLIAQRRTVADLNSRALSLDVALIKALGGQYTR